MGLTPAWWRTPVLGKSMEAGGSGVQDQRSPHGALSFKKVMAL